MADAAASAAKEEKPADEAADASKDTKEEDKTKTTPDAAPAATGETEKKEADAKEPPSTEDNNASSEERIRGGGKVSNESNRNARRHQPYGNNRSNEGGGPDRSLRVYVGNLSWNVSWQDLKDHMKSTGLDVVRANIMTTPDGRSKGCAIVEFTTAEGAQKAVETLNDTQLQGRNIFVREDREDRNTREGGGYNHNYHNNSGNQMHRFTQGPQSQSRRVYVGNLSWDVRWQDLKDHMRQAGEVLHAEVICESNGRSKGCGIVEFSTTEEAQEAITKLTDSQLKGRLIFVREDRETSSGGQSGSYGGGHGHRNTGDNSSVYVWNLSYETSWQDLKDHMRKAGNVDQATILSDNQGNSIGCAVVIYQKPQEAARAIRELQNSELHGRNIFLREDRNHGAAGRGDRGGHGGRHHGGRGRGGGRGYHQHHHDAGGFLLFVNNLSYDTSWQDLKDHFRQCGDVERAEVMTNADGRSKGFGTVRFMKEKDAEAAIQRLNGQELQGRTLEVRYDNKQQR